METPRADDNGQGWESAVRGPPAVLRVLPLSPLAHRHRSSCSQLTLDVGINSITDSDGKRRVVGDVALDEVSSVAGAITPVPGGVGPVTVAILLRSAAEAAAKQRAMPRRLP